MKTIVAYGLISLMALSMMPAPLHARPNSPSATCKTPVENPQAQVLLSRLEEIKSIDKTELTSSEKKELRKEVRSIKKELKTMSQGVYLSVGAIIIIVLLLILLI